jgi:replicative DNA helicase
MDKPNKYNNKNTPAKIDPSYFGKSAPQAKELEEAVLGALLVDKNVITVLVDILQEESFYDERHKVVYRAMLRLFEKGNPIDLLTVSQELRQMGSLETIGGAFYLTELANRVASAANVEYHSRIVLQKFLQRELIQLGTEVINDAFDETGDVFELLERTEQTLFKIAERNVSRGVVSLGVLLESVKEQIKNAANQKTGLSGVPTGFTALDRLTNGWQKSDLIIVAARPAMGKCLGKGTKVMLYNG